MIGAHPLSDGPISSKEAITLTAIVSSRVTSGYRHKQVKACRGFWFLVELCAVFDLINVALQFGSVAEAQQEGVL